MLSERQALQVIDGCMLGDARLHKQPVNASYSMYLSKILSGSSKGYTEREQELLRQTSVKDHLKLEQWIADNVFRALGVQVSIGYPKAAWRIYKGRKFQRAELSSRQSPKLTKLCDEWYTGGELHKSGRTSYMSNASKVVPTRLMQASVLPILTLVHWWLGDGGSSWNFSTHRSTFPQVNFAAQGFAVDEVEHLAAMLNNMGVHTTKLYKDKRVRSGSGLSIWVSQKSINYFMDIVEPHILEIFSDSKSPSYKDMIKRKSSVPISKSELYLSYLRLELEQ